MCFDRVTIILIEATQKTNIAYLLWPHCFYFPGGHKSPVSQANDSKSGFQLLNLCYQGK